MLDLKHESDLAKKSYQLHIPNHRESHHAWKRFHTFLKLCIQHIHQLIIVVLVHFLIFRKNNQLPYNLHHHIEIYLALHENDKDAWINKALTCKLISY